MNRKDAKALDTFVSACPRILGERVSRRAAPFNPLPKGAAILLAKARPDSAIVQARLAQKTQTITTSWGAKLKARKGLDMILSTGPKDRWVVRGDLFAATYAPVKTGQYRKRADLILGYWVAPRKAVIETLEGPVEAAKGDYVMIGAIGEMWPVKPEKFAAKYAVFDPARLVEKAWRKFAAAKAELDAALALLPEQKAQD